MPAGFGRAGARYVRSAQKVRSDREQEERYRNRWITFALNIVSSRGKRKGAVKGFFIPVNPLIFIVVFMRRAHPAPEKKLAIGR